MPRRPQSVNVPPVSGPAVLAASTPPEGMRGSGDARDSRPGGRRYVALLLAGAALVLLTGCKPVGPDYNRPGYNAPSVYKEAGASTVTPPPNPSGGAWQPANPSDGLLKGKWWEIYQDPQLNQLEERIATNNVQLKQALETYLAARDQVSAARANLYPTLSASVTPEGVKNSVNSPNWNKSSTTTYADLTIAGQASWEPDFWGRIRRTVEQARENAQASAAEVANVDLTLHAELATDYFALRGLDSEIKLFTATVADLEHQLDLTQRRFSGGVATAVDVAQARTQLETVRAQLVDLGVARAQYEHAIGTIANYDLSGFSIPASPLGQSPEMALPKIPLGVPSQLLERRPDIAEAERLAAAANAQIGIQISAFYPTITLNATAAFKAPIPARGFRARARSGRWARRPRSCCLMPASATRSPMPRATATKRKRMAIATRSSRPSRTWRTSLRACAFWSRRPGWSKARWIRRSIPLIYRIRATRAA